ncbi:MAG: hypothetical protein MUQ56_05540 [Thermoleophilia bacterium]|nr:hypothetical protein [Thermoleophilia bacterium]
MASDAPAAAPALQSGATQLTSTVGVGMLSSVGDYKGAEWTWLEPPTLFTTTDFDSPV